MNNGRGAGFRTTALAADMGVSLLGPETVEDSIAGLEERVACRQSLCEGRNDGNYKVELAVCMAGDCMRSICEIPSSKGNAAVKVQVHDALRKRLCRSLVANANQIIT